MNETEAREFAKNLAEAIREKKQAVGIGPECIAICAAGCAAICAVGEEVVVAAAIEIGAESGIAV